MDSDRLAGTLMCAGAIPGLLGLLGSTPFFFFPFSVLSGISFGLVFLFGVYVFRKRAEGRLLAAAALIFAPLGGAASVYVLWVALLYQWDLGIVLGSAGVLGMLLALAGASIKRVRAQN